MKKSHIAALLGASIASFAIVADVRAQNPAAPEAPAVIGVIKDVRGKPMAGVTVSARDPDTIMTTSVYTDERGQYVFPPLAAGHYRLWAQAVGFTAGRAELTLDGSHTVKQALTMKPLADFAMQLTGYEWFNSLPDDTTDHRRMKQVMYVACTGCHSLDIVLQNKFDETGWKAIVKSMETTTYNGYRGAADLPPSQLGWEAQVIRYHRDELAKYLAEVRGPTSPALNYKTMPRPTGEAARAVVTEYHLPNQGRANEATLYYGDDWSQGASTGMHGAVGVHDVLADPTGNAWITQSRTTFETNRSLVKLDPKTGKMTAYRATGTEGGILFFEQVGMDTIGNLWMHNETAVVKLDTKTEAFSLWTIPPIMGGMANSTDPDSKGHVFINGRYGVVELTTADMGRKDVAYPGWKLHQQMYPGNGITYGVTADADDNVWWSQSYADRVNKKDLKTGKVYEFEMRDPGYDARKALMRPSDLAFYESIGAGEWSGNSASPLPYANMPRRLSADKTGDTVWIPNWAQSNLAEINIHTLKVTYHPLPIQTHPYKTTVDKNHNVWTDSGLADAVFKYAQATGQWTMFPLPSHGCGSRHIGFDDYKNELWLPCDQSNKVDRIQFRTEAQVQALAAAAAPGGKR